ncbi:MAG: prepilin peptidase [Erysipelotrichaceae bacterium]|nr:prepilin peptidase [Erysipelotrichaceae bacterium]
MMSFLILSLFQSFFHRDSPSCFFLPVFLFLEVSIRDERLFLSYFFLMILYFQALSDRMTMTIYLPADLFLLLIGILESLLSSRNMVDLLLSASLLPLSLCLLDPKHEKMGEGDKEILFVSAFYLSYEELVTAFFLSTLFLLLISLIKKKTRFPYVPFWFVSCVIVTLCIHIPRGG